MTGKPTPASTSTLPVMPVPDAALLPAGVVVHELNTHTDERGELTEIFRESLASVRLVQWNLLRSAAGVFRGMQVHHRHTDHVVALSGEMVVGLQDLRPESITLGRAACFLLGGEQVGAMTIPPGVAHGFLFTQPSAHAIGVTHYWDTADEWGCRWDDPDLDIVWPQPPGLLTQRDADAPPLASFLDEFVRAYQNERRPTPR